MSKVTQVGISYRESILERAYRLDAITEGEYKAEKQKLKEIATKVENNENVHFDSKAENFWNKIRQIVIL